MKGDPSLMAWLSAALASAEEFSQQTLGIEDFQVNLISHDSPQKALLPLYMPQKKYLCGAYIPVIGEQASLLIGLFAAKDNCRKLTRLLLATDPQAEDPSPEAAADAVKETVNILSGLVQQRMDAAEPALRRGLPVFVEGFIQTTREQATVSAHIAFGELKFYLLVVRRETAPESAARDARDPRLNMSAEDWLRAAVSATTLFAQTALGIREIRSSSRATIDLPEEEVAGAYIPLIGEDVAALVGLVAKRDDLERLARYFVAPGMESHTLTPADLSDVLKEVLTILSGLLSEASPESRRVMRRGLPVFVDGFIAPTEDQEAYWKLLRMDNVETYLVIIQKKATNAVFRTPAPAA